MEPKVIYKEYPKDKSKEISLEDLYEKVAKIKQEDYKTRKEYLVAVAIQYLRNNPEDTIFFDEAECDGYCLADDLENEFDIKILN